MPNQEIINYLKNHFKATKWQFVSMNKIISDLKCNTSDLDNLKNEGIIAIRKGMNSDIIEILKLE
jgi:hypothetical protein